MTDTSRRLCGRVDGATACATTCWRSRVLDDEPCPAIEPGAGCGTGSDGLPCSPAYLCPSCTALLIASAS